jgi:hypothetical protein
MKFSGYGNEKQNEAVEKEYETAQAKGYRPCKFYHHYPPVKMSSGICKGPTCGKMVDLGPQKTFKWAAFEPSDRELFEYDRARKEAKRKLARRNKETPRKTSATSKSTSIRDIMDLSDSEDELPSVEGIGPSVKRQKKDVSGYLAFLPGSTAD